MTKREMKYIEMYVRSRKTNLYQCYKKPSQAKIKAEYLCRQKMEKQNGYDFRIISYNDCFFTCGWKADNFLFIETPSDTIAILLPF